MSVVEETLRHQQKIEAVKGPNKPVGILILLSQMVVDETPEVPYTTGRVVATVVRKAGRGQVVTFHLRPITLHVPTRYKSYRVRSTGLDARGEVDVSGQDVVADRRLEVPQVSFSVLLLTP